MAPKGNKRIVTTKQNNASVQEHGQDAAIDYATVQSDEVEALRAIFMEDFEEVAVENAWNKTREHRFKLKVGAFSDSKSMIVLSVRLTATYPKTAPLLEATGLESFHERTQARVRHVIAERPKLLLGEVMIHAITSEIQEILEDAVQARQQGALPSLDDERVNAEEVAQALAMQAEATQKKVQQEAEQEEQRVLDQMVKEELTRREHRKTKQASSAGETALIRADEETIAFDQSSLLSAHQQDLPFSSVIIVSKDGPNSVAKPLTPSTSQAPLVAILTRRLRSIERHDIEEVESLLERWRKLHHRTIQRLYLFRLDRHQNQMSVTLCTEMSQSLTLADLLALSFTLPADKARQYTIEILEGLEECHRHGILHGNISCEHIFLTRSTPASPILADFGGELLSWAPSKLPARWQPPEAREQSSKTTLKKSDVWFLGVVVLQMCLGLDVTKYSSPQGAWAKSNVTESFADLLGKMFHLDPRMRSTAFDLLTAEFLRSNDTIIDQDLSSGRTSDTNGAVDLPRRLRHESSNALEPMSRYAQDFVEIGRLGRGGFGEVVKARNKLDGGVYAIKKIHHAPQLDRILSEVMLLNRLNHPYVVRYYATWVEQDLSSSERDMLSSTTDGTLSGEPQIDFGYQSTGGLDFVSSRGYNQIEFGSDSESDEESDIFEVENGRNVPSDSQASIPPVRRRSQVVKAPSTLFIQMEFCERRSLRDLLHKGLQEDQAWRFVRQITEGLAHIHGHGIIHRDLKPDNIFIDLAGSPKIGDFGLATTAQYSSIERTHKFNSQVSMDMTMSIGTALYVAPEISASSGVPYTDKVDMYSLGVMFYEMCQVFPTAMERVQALQSLRKRDQELPAPYQQSGNKAAQGKVISCLVSHKAGERPSSAELLRAGLLPVKIEDETIRQALLSLTDRDSPNHQTMMSALFSTNRPAESQVRALAWDAKDPTVFDDALRLRARAVIKDALVSIFRLHGAEELPRAGLLPRANLYTSANVVQLLDASGNLLQLPYDLTLPMARRLARSDLHTRCTYTIDPVYRDTFSGGPPQSHQEIDFDIVTTSDKTMHSFHEAEVIKVVDEIVTEPTLALTQSSIAFYLNHNEILNLILNSAEIEPAQHLAVKDCLSKLGFRHFTWAKVRSELRSPALALSSWSVDYLQTFDWREPPEKAFTTLQDWSNNLGEHAKAKLQGAIDHIRDVVDHASRMSVTCRLLISPLSCINAKFYDNATMIQCVLERKSSRDVLAAGGRYDGLIKAARMGSSVFKPQAAVGISVGLDRLVANLLRQANSSSTGEAFTKDNAKLDLLAKRCNVLLLTGPTSTAQAAGTKVLATLWASGISAEQSFDEVGSDDQQYSFVLTYRHENATTIKVHDTSDISNESDVPLASIVSYLHQELREKQGIRRRHQVLGRNPSQQTVDRKNNVQVLMSGHRSKKSNKYHIVEAAQQKWAERLDQWKDAPILAVETRDDVLDLMRETRFSDAETWRKALHGVPPNERLYVQQIQELLQAWRRKWVDGEQGREACLYNFRTGHSIYYDLAL